MTLRDQFCTQGEDAANIKIGILIGSLMFVIVFFFALFTFLRCYLNERRRSYRRKFSKALKREDKAEADALKLLTFVAYLRTKNLLKSPSLANNGANAKRIQRISDDADWNELRRQVYEEIMALYGKDDDEAQQSDEDQANVAQDQSGYSFSAGSTASAMAKQHQEWYNENVAAGEALPDDIHQLYLKNSTTVAKSPSNTSSSPSPPQPSNKNLSPQTSSTISPVNSPQVSQVEKIKFKAPLTAKK